MNNFQIANILKEIGEYLVMKGELIFKVKAYEKAGEAIESLSESLSEIYRKGGLKALEEIPGVGTSIAEKIEELLKTGHLKYYEKLKKKTPVSLSELSGVEGLGPKSILKLYEELDIKNLKELEKAAREGKIGKLDDFGKKSEEKILRGIDFLSKSGGRFVLGYIRPLIKEIEERLKKLKEAKKVIVAGSVRRWKETIGDIDVLITSDKPKLIMDYFVKMHDVAEVISHGATKSSIKLKNRLNVDLRVVPEESYGAALNYFTGSKEHNIILRQRAIERGLKLSEYGLFKGDKIISSKTEEGLYEALDLKYIEPELREGADEIAAAEKNQLPNLIGYDDLKGDLQIQTTWTDGAHSIEEMAREAIEKGLEYIAITDHTKRLAMIMGLDEKIILQQIREINKLNEQIAIGNWQIANGKKFKILKGSECDILKNGEMDLPDEILSQLDVVGASIHSYFNLSKKEQTERIKKAMHNPHVDIIFHPTGRILNKRPAYELDIDDIIETAKKTGTILEIDAFPDRLDLKDEYIRKCVQAGVKMSIDSDSHSLSHFSVLEYGIAQARRGWASKNDIINAWPLEKMTSFLK